MIHSQSERWQTARSEERRGGKECVSALRGQVSPCPLKKYIMHDYLKYHPSTTFISYGADLFNCDGTDRQLEGWYLESGITKKAYYLIV